MTNFTNMTNAALADAFGNLKAEMAELAKTEKAIKAAISARFGRRDGAAIEGEQFRVAQSICDGNLTVDKEAVEKLLGYVPTKRGAPYPKFRVSSRAKKAA